jgi:ABC-type transport system involved in multi-copper enzyme maturation permease subunit
VVARELIQMSSRRRTYLLRVAYAVALFALATFFYWDEVRLRGNSSTWDLLGTGDRLLEHLASMQILGIWLFLPAMVAPALTVEKERQTLPLLFLTGIGPTMLLVEKLVSRLIPMFSLILLSLPLLMVAYAIGGISSTQMINTVWVVLLTTLQIGCLALCCSACCRSTVSAFIASYLVGTACVLGIPLGLLLIDEMLEHTGLHSPFVGPLLANGGLTCNPRDGIFGLTMTLYLQLELSRSTPVSRMVHYSLPILTMSGLAFGLARIQLVRRAFLPPRNHLRQLFEKIDRVLTSLNRRFAGSVVLIRDKDRLPEDEPVAWHETTKKSLGTFRYLLRVLLLLEIPVVVISVLALAVVGNPHNPVPETVSVVQIVIWFLVILIVSAKASSLFAGERSRQTLEILLSTPLSTRDLVRQKFRGVHRLILTLSVPLLTTVAFATYWRFEFRSPLSQLWINTGYFESNEHHPLCYMTCGVLAVLIYPRMIAWLSLWIGMVCRSPTRAILLSVMAVVAWCAIPALLVAWLETEYPMWRHQWIGWLFLSSPAAIVPLNEFSEFSTGMNPWLATTINFLVYGSLTLFFRHVAINTASHWLKRPE